MRSKDLVLAIDLGTTYFKTALFDRTGQLRGLVRQRVDKDEDDLRCELPVDRFWKILKEGIATALNQAGAGEESIQGIGYCSQANTFLLLDRDRAPLTPLILWTDRRASQTQDTGLALWDRPDFLNVTGLGLSGPEFCVAKLQWFRDRAPHVWRRTARLQTLSDYLLWNLTGQDVGDEGTASLLGIWDLRDHAWWRQGLEAAGLTSIELSSAYPPGTLAGKTWRGAEERLGLRDGIPVAVGTLDHHAGALGGGACSSDVPSMSIGTVVACLRYLDDFAPMPGCAMGPGTHSSPFYLLAFEENGTAALDRYHHSQCPDLLFEQMLSLASEVPAGSDGLRAHPAGGACQFENLSASHQNGHFVRALMESTAASLADLIRRIYPGDPPETIVASGGGSRSDFWLQLLADVCAVDFAVPSGEETACLGAAMLAAVTAGWCRDLSEATAAWSLHRRVISPNPESAAFYRDWLAQQPQPERYP